MDKATAFGLVQAAAAKHLAEFDTTIEQEEALLKQEGCVTKPPHLPPPPHGFSHFSSRGIWALDPWPCSVLAVRNFCVFVARAFIFLFSLFSFVWLPLLAISLLSLFVLKISLFSLPVLQI